MLKMKRWELKHSKNILHTYYLLIKQYKKIAQCIVVSDFELLRNNRSLDTVLKIKLIQSPTSPALNSFLIETQLLASVFVRIYIYIYMQVHKILLRKKELKSVKNRLKLIF